MNRMAEVLAGSALVVGVASGCAEAPNPQNNYAEHERLATDISEYWNTLGGSALSDAQVNLHSVRLETLLPGEETECSSWNQETHKWEEITLTGADEDSAGTYCAIQDKIVVNDTAYRQAQHKVMQNNHNPEAFDALFMSHEFGHAVQDQIRSLEATPSGELWADCLGAQALQAVRPELVDDVLAIYRSNYAFGEHSKTHGARQQRVEQVEKGAGGVYGCASGIPVHKQTN